MIYPIVVGSIVTPENILQFGEVPWSLTVIITKPHGIILYVYDKDTPFPTLIAAKNVDEAPFNEYVILKP